MKINGVDKKKTDLFHVGSESDTPQIRRNLNGVPDEASTSPMGVEYCGKRTTTLNRDHPVHVASPLEVILN